MALIGTILQLAIQVVVLFIIADVIISWIPSIPRYHPVVVMIRNFTHPVLAPFRKVLPPQRVGDGYIDFSPLVAVLTLTIVGRYILPFVGL